MKNKTIGLALPITLGIYENLSKKKRAVFFKFMPHETSPKNLELNQKLFFYLSKRIVGESKIKEIKMVVPDEIAKSFSDKILIDNLEFKEYICGREEKKALVLIIEDIVIYSLPVELDYYVTMGGRYIKEKEYRSWLKRVRSKKDRRKIL